MLSKSFSCTLDNFLSEWLSSFKETRFLQGIWTSNFTHVDTLNCFVTINYQVWCQVWTYLTEKVPENQTNSLWYNSQLPGKCHWVFFCLFTIQPNENYWTKYIKKVRLPFLMWNDYLILLHISLTKAMRITPLRKGRKQFMLFQYSNQSLKN